MASNWRVGGEQGVLSGRRYIVLCDKMVWAELHTTDKDKLPSVAEELGMNQKEGERPWMMHHLSAIRVYSRAINSGLTVHRSFFICILRRRILANHIPTWRNRSAL